VLEFRFAGVFLGCLEFNMMLFLLNFMGCLELNMMLFKIEI